MMSPAISIGRMTPVDARADITAGSQTMARMPTPGSPLFEMPISTEIAIKVIQNRKPCGSTQELLACGRPHAYREGWQKTESRAMLVSLPAMSCRRAEEKASYDS
jgi:hypothetical protein